MQREDLGYNTELDSYRKERGLEGFDVARVIAEHRERYVVKTVSSEYEAEITGNLRFTAQGREDFPAVGDWVAVSTYDEGFAVIHAVLPRCSILKRRAVGKSGEIQIIAANVDFAFLLQAAGRDFNINRLERYITICNAAGIVPIIVLTKSDLADAKELEENLSAVHTRLPGISISVISNVTQDGFAELGRFFQKGKTYCLLGSSGVGKSSLLNNLCKIKRMKTGDISASTHKGRHVTSHRELVVLENGSLLIDTPGMREVGIADADGGVETTFDAIFTLSAQCRFDDCTHTTETGCAVLAALSSDRLERDAYDHYIKLLKERAHFETAEHEKRKKGKVFGKIVKNMKKIKSRYKER
ncbi:MAG: ribosome small subunit-dependent GTPase A [Spirochaetales bacterium]|nr:ribosome small subunit-dependent GTPase A [Spirochaetales bacterium]